MSGAGVTGDKATPAKLGLREPKLRSLQAEMIAEEARKCSRKNEGVRGFWTLHLSRRQAIQDGKAGRLVVMKPSA